MNKWTLSKKDLEITVTLYINSRGVFLAKWSLCSWLYWQVIRSTKSHEDIFDVGFVLNQLKEEIRSSERLSFRSHLWIWRANEYWRELYLKNCHFNNLQKPNDLTSGLTMQVSEAQGGYIWVTVSNELRDKPTCFFILSHSEISALILSETWVVWERKIL